MNFREENMNKQCRLWLLISIVALIVVACGDRVGDLAEDRAEDRATVEEDRATVEEVRRLIVAVGHLPLSPDTAIDIALEANVAYDSMYDKLLLVEDGERRGRLAESWQAVSETTWQFTLKENIPFQCGGTLTAEDVKFTVDYHLNPDTQSRRIARLIGIESAEVVDELTFNLHTDGPAANVIPNLAFLHIYPKEYFQSMGAAGFAEKPCGTGPFELVEWEPDNFFRFRVFKDYYRGASQIDELVIRNVPEEASRIAALEAGEVQLIYDISPEEAERLESRGFTVDITPRGRMAIMTIRTTLDTPFQDQRVRQAANYCVNVEELNAALLGGLGKISGQLVGDDAVGYNPNIDPYPFDPERGKQLLAEAGYSNGFDAEMVGSVGLYYRDQEVQEAIASQLETYCNIRVSLVALESSPWLERYYAGEMPELFFVEWNYAPAMDLDADAQNFVSYEINRNPTTIIDEPEINELFLEQRRTLDLAERSRVLQELSAKYHEAAPGIFLWQPPNVAAYSPGLSGLWFRADFAVELIEATCDAETC
jgi:peptide/nickel transport system substrate-binding protein